MDNTALTAAITGTAVIIAAIIQASGNVFAAKHKAAVTPPKNDIVQEVTQKKITKPDWGFWVIMVLGSIWWIFNIAYRDFIADRLMFGLVILVPCVAVLMIVVKIMTRNLDR